MTSAETTSRAVEAPVTSVRAAAYRIATDGPEADGTLAWESTPMTVCHIEAGGQTGFGYTYADPACAHFIQGKLADVLTGGDALDVAKLWRSMLDEVRNDGTPGIAAHAISACDAALHDLRAKLIGLPLARVLGMRHDSVQAYGSGGFTTYDEQRLRDQLGGWAAEGFAAIKMKVGEGADRDRERVRQARDAVGPDVALMIDANGAYAPKEALEIAHELSSEGVVWFEEPVSSDDLDGLRLVREAGPPKMRVAAGEYNYRAWDMRRMLEARAVDVLQADAGRCCGITGFLQADALAWAHNVPLSSHTAPALHLQAAACCQRFRHMEWFHDHARVEAMLFDGAPEPKAGRLAPDLSRPGLGLDLKTSDAERFKVWPTDPV